MRIAKRAIFVCLSALLLSIWGGAIPSLAEEQTVKVGYMDYSGFIEPQSDGTFIGYGAEYLSKISEYTGFEYEYVSGNAADLFDMVKNGEIDLFCSAQYTPERDEIYDYTAYPIGYTEGLLYTTEDNDAFSYEDFKSFEGMEVGIIRANAMRTTFEQYAQKHDFLCHIREYDTETDMLTALQAGEIDAMCSEHLANHTDLSLLARFGTDAYYIISYEGSPYISQINYALQQIKTNVDYETILFHKYYDSSSAAKALQFTTDERAFIENSDEIIVGLNADREPFSTYDEQTGTFKGICVDVMDRIAEKSGLKFKYVIQERGKTIPEMYQSGGYDIFCGVERDNFVTNESLTSTEAFLESEIVPVTAVGRKLDINSDLTAAIPSSFQALKKRLENNHPNLKLTFYPTNRECLDAVKRGEADIFIQNTHILSLLLQEPRYENLAIMPIEIMTEHTAIAVPRDADSRLRDILNKSILNIGSATITSSLIEHTFATPYKYTTGDVLYKFRLQIIIGGILVLICFLLLVRVAIVRHKSEVKLQKKNAQLAEAVAQADRASTAKSEFLSRMSHEIRTPMNAVVGFTEIMKQHKDDANKIGEYLNKIEISSKVLLNIINDVLDMSAIESNKLKIANTEFDLKQVLLGINTMYYPQCRDKGVKFEIVVDLENEILIGDGLRVNQILLNLVSNAYKFTEQGGTIRLSVEENARQDNIVFLRFRVEDTGCGMSPEMQERLFQPFEQETADTAKKYGGSGLGLSIAKNLVSMMHGAIHVESEKGKGTAFIVELPFELGSRKSNEGDDTRIKSLRMLCVDDDAAVREYTEIVLKRLDVTFDMASSGAEARTLFEGAVAEGSPYDVCLVDWLMPDMDGIEFTHWIRENEKKRTSIIMVSAFDFNEVEEKGREAGADYFISKPLFQSTIFNVLMTLTNGGLKEESAEPDDYDFTGHRALLAEDQELNAEIAIELLEMVHLQVERVENGQKAVERFSQMPPETYDIILMDVQMPVMDGYEASSAIRALDREDAKEIPIFAMTANAFTEDVSKALSAGMNGHIPKPIDTSVLYSSIQKAIRS